MHSLNCGRRVSSNHLVSCSHWHGGGLLMGLSSVWTLHSSFSVPTSCPSPFCRLEDTRPQTFLTHYEFFSSVLWQALTCWVDWWWNMTYELTLFSHMYHTGMWVPNEHSPVGLQCTFNKVLLEATKSEEWQGPAK